MCTTFFKGFSAIAISPKFLSAVFFLFFICFLQLLCLQCKASCKPLLVDFEGIFLNVTNSFMLLSVYFNFFYCGFALVSPSWPLKVVLLQRLTVRI